MNRLVFHQLNRRLRFNLVNLLAGVLDGYPVSGLTFLYGTLLRLNDNFHRPFFWYTLPDDPMLIHLLLLCDFPTNESFHDFCI
jgi:hypothetical protein